MSKNVFFRGVLPVLTGILGLISNSVEAEVHLSTDTQSEQIAEELSESLVREYLLARYGIGSDLKELEERWGTSGPVFWMSSQSVYDDFVWKESKHGQIFAFEDNFIRNVQILSLLKTSTGGSNGSDQWVVVLKFTDTDRRSAEPKEHEWVATLETSFRPTRQNLTQADRLKNPLGFVVDRFSLEKKAK